MTNNLTEFQIAMAYHEYKSETEWSEFMAQIHRMNDFPTLRKGYGQSMLLSCAVTVNGRSGTLYNFNNGQYLLIKMGRARRIGRIARLVAFIFNRHAG